MARKSNMQVSVREIKKFDQAVDNCKEKIPDIPVIGKNLNRRKTMAEVVRENTDQLRLERDFLKEIISAISHPFYVIDANDHRILMANQTAANIFGNTSDHPFCYSWTHGRSTPCAGRDHPCPL